MTLGLENRSNALSVLSYFAFELEHGNGLGDQHEIPQRVMPDVRERPRHRNQADQDEWRKLLVENAIDKNIKAATFSVVSEMQTANCHRLRL